MSAPESDSTKAEQVFLKKFPMSKSIKYSVLTLSLAIVAFTVIGGLGVRASTNSKDGSYNQQKVMSEVIFNIYQSYVDQPNMAAVSDGALHGLLESLDANSSYLNPNEYKEYKGDKPGNASIAAFVSKRFGYGAIVSVMPGGA